MLSPDHRWIKSMSLIHKQQLMAMKTITSRGDGFMDHPHEARLYDDYERISGGSGLDQPTEEVYRCPVTTPTVTRRPDVKMRSLHQPFVAFTSMNHSLHIPHNIATAKQFAYKSAKTKRPMAKPQQKNFDCYFVNNTDVPNHIDAQVKSTWLNSLCSQPVSEIFGKYKRRSESNRCQLPARVKNSTPGEKALVHGWSSNASSRGTPSVMSKSIRSGVNGQVSTNSRSSRVSSTDTYQRTLGYEQDSEYTAANGFTMMPMHSGSPQPTSTEPDDVSSLRSSPLFQKVFRHNGNQPSMVSFNGIGIVNSHNVADQRVYEPFQRDKRFPEMRTRKSNVSPTRRHVPSEERPFSETTLPPTHELQESALHIVSVGKLANDSKTTDDIMTMSDIQIAPMSDKFTTGYRLPKNPLSGSLQELHQSKG